jgi:hypothetical protein
MRLSLLILLTLLFRTAYADLCGFEGTLRSIVRNPHAAVIDGEKKIAGIILESSQHFPTHLDDGFYIYISDSKGRIVYSPRVPDIHDLENPIASHRALTEQWKLHHPGETPEMLAAGEFEVSHGRISEINNKANTYHGNGTHLNYASDLFQKRGLRIEPETLRVDYATTKPAETHQAELLEAKLMQTHLRDPQSQQLIKIYRQFENEVYVSYPSKVPGKPDWNQFMFSEHPKIRHVAKREYWDLSPSESDLLFDIPKLSNGREFDYFARNLMKAHPAPDQALIEILRSFEGIHAD